MGRDLEFRSSAPVGADIVVNAMADQIKAELFTSPQGGATALFHLAMSWTPEVRMSPPAAAAGAYTDMTLDRITCIRKALDVLEASIVKES